MKKKEFGGGRIPGAPLRLATKSIPHFQSIANPRDRVRDL